MRIRIIPVLAAVGAPAALAGVLLGTAGQAGAAVTQGPAEAALTANLQQTYTGKVSQTGVPDTTSVGGGATVNNDSNQFGPIGPVWAYDNITRNVQVSPAGPGQWTVSFVENGTYSAFADPNTAASWINTGNMHGTISYTVQSDNAPKIAALAQANGSAVDGTTVHGHGYIINLLFPGAPVVGYGPYSYHYTQIPDVPGVYQQVG